MTQCMFMRLQIDSSVKLPSAFLHPELCCLRIIITVFTAESIIDKQTHDARNKKQSHRKQKQ